MGTVLRAACTSALLQSCTLLGAGTGAIVDASTPGPYKFQPFPGHGPSAGEEVSASYALEKGDFVKLKLANGSVVEGRYAGLTGPTAQDPESYLVLNLDLEYRRARPNGQMARFVASDIREVGVEVSGHGWVYGLLIGLALDVILVRILSTADFNVQ
jgi:hypothetical protein